MLSQNTYGAENILMYLIGALALMRIDFKVILKANVLSQTILFIITYILYISGYTVDIIAPKGGHLMHDFGYGNPNTLSIFLSYYMLSLFLLIPTKFRLTFTIISIIIASSYILTRSRSIIVVTLLLNIYLLMPKILTRKILTNKIIIITLLAIIPFSVIFILYSSDLDEINRATSSRVMFMAIMMSEFSLKTLITGLTPPEDAIIDNVYMLLVTYGGILILIYILYRFYMIMTHKEYDYKYLCVLGVSFVIGYVEAYYLNPFISGTYLIWSLLIGNKSLANENCSGLRHLQPKCIITIPKSWYSNETS